MIQQVLPFDMGNRCCNRHKVLVKAGDHVTKEQGLVTLEGEKATMEIPAPWMKLRKYTLALTRSHPGNVNP